MASPLAVATVAQGRNISAAAAAAALPEFSFRLCPRAILGTHPPLVLKFPSRSRAYSRHLIFCISGRRPSAACLRSSPSSGFPNSDESLEENCMGNKSSSSSNEEIFDLKLPRRSLLVEFTCKSCGERTQRLINRVAYERGTVFVQCAGCLVHHKLVDNLNLVVEYDFRDKIGTLDKTGPDEDLS